MISRQLVRAGLLTLVLTLGGGSAILTAARADSGGAAVSAPAREIQVSCNAPSLGGRLPAVVYLPSGYSAMGAPLPVIYFLHGLPATPQAYTYSSFIPAALASAGRRAIVVVPQGARGRGLSDREYLDWSPTENWPQAIARDLTSCIDQRYDTIRGRRGRALVGLSAGGYGAFNVGLRNLQTFGAVESWSGYFAATDPSGYHRLKFSSAQAQRAATVPTGSALAAELKRHPSLIGFFVGRGDARFAQDNQRFDASLRASGVGHVYRTYPGGHSQSLWTSEAPAWLGMALTYLSTGRTVDPRRG